MTLPDHTNQGHTSLTPWERFLVLYFRVLSFIVRRVVAPWFMVLGSIATLMDGLWVLMGKPVDVNGVPSTSVVVRLGYVAAPLSFAIIGWLLWHMKPLDPHDNLLKRTFDKMVKTLQ